MSDFEVFLTSESEAEDVESIVSSAAEGFPIDGNLSPDKIDLLMDRDHEEDWLDFKETWDVAERLLWAELARDLAAMANTEGGWIIVGLKEEKPGTPGPRYTRLGISDELAQVFEVTKIWDKVSSYIEERLQLKAAAPVLRDGKTYGIVFVWRRPDEPIVMARNAGDDHSALFRSGDVFVRRAASTVRANQADMRRLMKRYAESEAQRLIRELFPEKLLTATFSAIPPELDYIDDDPTATATKMRQLFRMDRADVITLSTRDSMARLTASAQGEKIDSRFTKSLDRFLQGILAAGALAISYSKLAVFDELTAALVHAYDTVGRRFGENTEYPPGETAKAWLKIMGVVYALGAGLLATRKFEYIPALVDPHPGWGEPYWKKRSWLRHALTMASRAKVLDRPSLVPLGVEDAMKEPELRSALHDEDATIEAACQFDFLANVRIWVSTHDNREPFPNFGLYFNQRTEPIIEDLVAGGDSRKALPESTKEQDIANAITVLDSLASEQFFSFGGWDSGLPKPVRDFIDRHGSA